MIARSGRKLTFNGLFRRAEAKAHVLVVSQAKLARNTLDRLAEPENKIVFPQSLCSRPERYTTAQLV